MKKATHLMLRNLHLYNMFTIGTTLQNSEFMVRRLWCYLFIIVGCGACTASPPAPIATTSPNPLLVAAASDLIPAFEELGVLFTAQTGIEVVFNFGSTGQLAQQIEQGAPVDVFAAANVSFINTLQSAGLVIEDTIATYAFGRLTVWTHADSPFTFTSLDDLTQPGINRIAIANPEHAPYGIAAREALQAAGLWDILQPSLILGENIAQAFQYAETGNVDAAIVALSLSIAAGESGRWMLIPETLHNPLQQTLVVIKSTPRETAARQFALFVNSAAGREVMQRFGFILPDEELQE
jgi:molybdate transport system substrate-binding protein